MNDEQLTRRRWLQSTASLAGLAWLSGVLSACGGSSESASSGSDSEGNVTQLTLGCNGDELALPDRDRDAVQDRYCRVAGGERFNAERAKNDLFGGSS